MNKKEELLNASLSDMKELLKLEKEENKYRIRHIIDELEWELYNRTNKWEAVEK